MKWIVFYLARKLLTAADVEKGLVAVGDLLTEAAAKTPTGVDDYAVSRLREAIDEKQIAALVEKILS